MVRRSTILFTCLLICPSFAASSDGCEGAGPIVAECQVIHGRLFVANGNPSVRIWPVGTKRHLGIAEVNEKPFVPDALRSKLSLNTQIFGDFDVCPLSKERPGEMQRVCVRSASKLVVREQ
jgi:hypothetical protein